MRKAINKLLLATLAIAVGLPVGHITYDLLRAPAVDVESPAWQTRLDVLARAKVFPVDRPALEDGAWGARLDAAATIECRYEPRPTSGTTPKFDCRLPSGDVIKVKYGLNPEIPAEVAATRLLTSLGFGADQVSIARRVRCHGCPRSPYRARQIAEWYFLDGFLDRALDYTSYTDFDYPAIERRLPWRAIEAGEAEGFGFYELPLVDASRGGATMAELDAFRLVAVFLAHWDNKAANQRLVCAGERADAADGPCASPLLMIQDAGATFGPRKVNYEGWTDAPIWRSADICLVSMSDMPFDGATFTDAVISEEGRALLAGKLSALTEADIEALFLSSRFPDATSGESVAADVTPWVRTFQRKVREITTRVCAPSPSRRSPPRG